MTEKPIELIERVRGYVEKATPGPWRWFGNTKYHQIYLATVGMGRRYVLDFVRWGTASAQPRFQVYPDDESPPVDAWSHGLMTKASELVEYEVEYRRDIVGINHPDAHLLKQGRTDLPEAIDRLEAACRLLESADIRLASHDGLKADIKAFLNGKEAE